MSTAPNRFYVGGEWRSSQDAKTADIINPFNGSVVGTVCLASETDKEDAIQRGVAGFHKTRALPSYQRSEILTYISRGIKEQKEEFARLITAEIGKPIQFSRIEVDRAVTTFQLAAEEAKRIVGEVVPLDLASSSENRFGVVRRFPIGIVLGIAPFNFPLNLVAHKLAPAIASGNAFILKPPPQAPLTSLKLAEIVDASGFPKEALSVLPCSNELAEKLVLDERIKMLSFTGSANVGWYLKSKAGKKKVLLELGGNAGLIIDKGINVDETVKRNAVASFANAGQVCIKVQRIYVHQDIYEEYERKFVEATKAIKMGDPSDSATVVGPMIDDSAANRVFSWIEEAKSKSAKALVGGPQNKRIFEPTVLVNVARDAKIFCNEVFGPVVSLHKVKSVEEAVEGINDSPFGLQAGIFSNDFKNIMYAYNHLDVGAVIVNDNPTFRVDNMPYGGVKDSGFGREGVRYAVEEMTEPKQLVVS